LGLTILPITAFAQQKTLKEQLVGTWLLVSAETTNPDGTKFQTYGTKPVRTTVYDATGHYSNINVNTTIRNFASNNRSTGTADENKSVVQGSIGNIGTYTVDEASKTMLMHVDGSTFPNSNGQDQERLIQSISATQMSYINTVRTAGAEATLFVFKRAQ